MSLELANQTAAASMAACPAVGVGGAPGGHLDEQCATAALDKIKDKLK
ncbi:MAG: hypothetical protein ABI809_02660 [Caldimonas sp.]